MGRLAGKVAIITGGGRYAHRENEDGRGRTRLRRTRGGEGGGGGRRAAGENAAEIGEIHDEIRPGLSCGEAAIERERERGREKEREREEREECTSERTRERRAKARANAAVFVSSTKKEKVLFSTDQVARPAE